MEILPLPRHVWIQLDSVTSLEPLRYQGGVGVARYRLVRYQPEALMVNRMNRDGPHTG